MKTHLFAKKRLALASCVCAVALAHSRAPQALAQLPEPKLSVLAPAGARSGESAVVKITGTDTDEAELVFSHAEIKAVRDPKDPKQFTLTIAPGVPAGAYDVRLLGKFGVSNPRRFEVSTLPEIDAAPKAATREESQEISLPCVVRGNAQKQQIQWFKFSAVKGAELVFDCHAWELDSRMDPLLVLYDASGRELLRSRRRPLRWNPTSDQPLFLAVRDFLSNGGPEHFYRLYAGGPKDLPASPPQAPLVFWPPSDKGLAEAEPNDPSRPQKVTLPLEVHGKFAPARDVDAFLFNAKTGEEWWVECISNRLGQPTHPRVVIEQLTKSADGKEVPGPALELPETPWFPGDPDFDGLHFDPSGKFVAKAEGTYRLTLRDTNNTTDDGSPRRYALSVRRPAPDFALVCAVQTAVPNKGYASANGPLVTVRAANLRPGQALPLRVMVVRRDGFEGIIQLSAEGLPAGISADPCLIGTKQSEGTLLLRATPDAQKWAGPIKVTGRAKIGDSEIKHTARCSTPIWESAVGEFIEPGRGRFAAEMTLAVVEDAPITSVARVDQDCLEAKPDAKLKIALRIERPAPATAPIKLKLLGLPGLEKAKLKDAEIPVKEGKTEYELDLAPLKLSPGTYMVWFRGDEKIKRDVKGAQNEVNVNLCSNPLTLNLK